MGYKVLFMANFYSRMEKIAREKGLNIADISRACNISQPSMNNWKNGGVPKVDVAVRIANLLGTTVEFLATGESSEVSEETMRTALDIESLPLHFRQVVIATLESCKSQMKVLRAAEESEVIDA